MPVKSIIDVAVNDEAFNAFHALFNEYKDELAKTPAQWKDVDKVVGELHSSFEAMTAALVTHADMTGKIATTGKKQTLEIQTQARHWGLISRATKESGLHLKDMTTNLLKWSSITSLIPAAIGAGGLFGVEKLAQTATERRRTAMGVGATAGGQRAFDTGYGRVAGEGFVGRVGQELETPGSVGLRMLDMKEKDLQGSTEDVAVRAIIAAQKIAKADPVWMLGADPKLKMFDLEERRRLKETPDAEFESLKEKYAAGKKAGALEDKDLAKWTELSTAIGKAKDQIEATFITGLAPAAPKIGEFVAALVKGTSITGGALDEWGKDLKEFWTKLLKGPAALNKPEPPEKFGSPWNHAIPQSFHGDLNNAEAKLIPAVWAPGGGLSGLGRGGGLGGGGGQVDEGGGPMRAARDASISGNVGGSSDESGSPMRVGGAESYGGGPSGDSGSPIRKGWGASIRRGHASAPRATEDYGKENLSIPRGTGRRGSLKGVESGSLRTTMAALEDQLRREGVPEENAHAAAAMLAGNAVMESKLNPRAVHDQGTGYGIYGARLERRTRMLAWEAGHGFAGDSLEGQSREMAHSAMSSRFPQTRRTLMGATGENLGHGASTVMREFEAPKPGPGANEPARRAAAARAFAGTRTPAMAEGKSHPSQTGIARNPATTHHTPYHGFRIEVQNNTGGNAVVSSSALAAGHA